MDVPYNGQLDAFDLYHQYAEDRQPKRLADGPVLPALGDALAGSAGSAISSIVTYPLDLIITRLQIQRQLRKKSSVPETKEYKSIVDAASRIYEEEGASTLYAGALQNTAKTVVDSFLFFLAYNSLRQARLKSRNASQHLPVFDELGVGFVAGALSRFSTTPISNIVTRLQTASMMSSSNDGSQRQRATVRSIAAQIRAEKGIKGFWSGYSASLILTLNPSLTFFFFESLKRVFLPRSRRENPPASATFLLAATSKALASTITYPFSLAKSRAQVSSKSVDSHEFEDEPVKGSNLEEKSAPVAKSKKAVRRTVFSTILEIVRTEGVSALYEGLSGEVFKGFFNHGITMLMKEIIHKLIIRLYYLVLKALRKYPSSGDLLQQVQDTANEAKEQIKDSANLAQQSADATVSRIGTVIDVGVELVKGAAKGEA